jgi:hypothetical protein
VAELSGSLARSRAGPVAPRRSSGSPGQAPAAAGPGRPGGGRAWFAVLFLIALIIPNFFIVGPIRLSPYRLVLFLALVPLVILWLRGAAGPIRRPDILILLSCLWGAMGLFITHGTRIWANTSTLEASGILLAETFGAYLIGRICIRNSGDFVAIAKVLFLILAVLVPFALAETLTGQAVYIRMFAPFGQTLTEIDMASRLGLERVQGPFEHPILFGVFCASAFAIAFFALTGVRRILLMGASGFCTFVSLSTGAFLALLAQIGIIAWGWLFRNNPKRWRNLILLCIAGYVTVDVLSNRTPFEVFVSYATFNTGSAFNRVLIWKYGSAEVMRHPLIGIGFNNWQRPQFMGPSVDNFWLVIAMRHGLPALVLLVAAFLAVFRSVGRVAGLGETERQIRLGLLTSLVGVSFAICSVHLWNASFCWYMFLFGAAMWLLDAGQPTEAAAAAALSPGERRARARAAAAPPPAAGPPAGAAPDAAAGPPARPAAGPAAPARPRSYLS